MKKLTTTFILFALISMNGFSQIQKGNLLLGGTGSFTTYNSGINKNRTLNLNPSLGYFVSDKIAIGSSLSFYFMHSGSTTGIGFGISPFARYYFLKKETSSFFIPVRVSLSSTNYQYQNSNNDNTTYSSTRESFGIGYTRLIAPNVGLEASLSYYFIQTANNIMQDPTTDYSGLDLQIGFQIYFNRQK